jgi:hypothetical protein
VTADERMAVQLATKALDGSMSAIVAVRALLPLLGRLGLPREDEIIETLVAIESETDALPVGHERREWASEVLRSRAADIASAEEWARNTGREAFNAVLQRWRGSGYPATSGDND